MEQTRKHHDAQSRTARDRIVDREVAKLENRRGVHGRRSADDEGSEAQASGPTSGPPQA